MNVLPHGPTSGRLQLDVRQWEVLTTEVSLNFRDQRRTDPRKIQSAIKLTNSVKYIYVFPELHRGGHPRLREIAMMQWMASPLNQSYSLPTRMFRARPWESQTEQARSLLRTIDASVDRNRSWAQEHQGLLTSKTSAYNTLEVGMRIPESAGREVGRIPKQF